MTSSDLSELIERVRCWLNGWRLDMDGFLVRARRASDPDRLPSEDGFVEECAIAARSVSIARRIDRLTALQTQENNHG